MDPGAHFHKCDFQVHTPRDTNWTGGDAVTDEERREFAQGLVAACRERGLQAVAITDHHDIVFCGFIREAAWGETDGRGRPLPPEDRLVVFPGIELTLGIPCQALLIFDADLPGEFLPLALSVLGITPAVDSASKHAPVKKLDIMSFEDLYAALNKLEPLRNHFIVIPHVGDGGYKTLIRKDFEKHYIGMPCVGGYLDGALPEAPKSSGMRSILNGEDKNWGNKALGLFQTSDSRSSDFEALGKYVTWVKWARPTAEALRQACLARHSRIAHSEPSLPAIQLTLVEVSNSKFLGPIALEFNPQYNAIIGGRGTGKSTILEYIRWALCDQPPTVLDGSSTDLADFQRRRQGLIEGTLLPLGGVIDVWFLVNGVSHIVRRKSSGELSLRIGEGAFEPCIEQNIRDLLPVRAYSQKQLSAVGARREELRRFVNAPIQSELDSVAERIREMGANIRSAFDRVVRYRTIKTDIESHEIARHSLNEQIETLRSSLKGLTPTDREIIDRQASYEAEQRAVQSLERDLQTAKDALKHAENELMRLPKPLDVKRFINADLLKDAHLSLSAWTDLSRRAVVMALGPTQQPPLSDALAPFGTLLNEWRGRRATHLAEYEAARTRAAAHQETLSQVEALEERLAQLNESVDIQREQLIRLADPEAEFSSLREDWVAAHTTRGDLLTTQCALLTGIASSRLRATLKRSADIGPLGEELKQVFRGTKARGDRIERLVQQVASAVNPLGVWQEILDELQTLAWSKVDDEAVTILPNTPRLENAGLTAREKLALARQLSSSSWLDLFLFDLSDLPVFEYQVREDDFLPFEKASPGQQATALLTILLLQDGPPLLIDQPEDDLNMKIISDVVSTLWNAKTHRQVIFASHNANLVVNGDAELVICSDYRTHATESGGQLKLVGAIDMPEINREITDVMEGGEAAFKLRHQKYGF